MSEFMFSDDIYYFITLNDQKYPVLNLMRKPGITRPTYESNGLVLSRLSNKAHVLDVRPLIINKKDKEFLLRDIGYNTQFNVCTEEPVFVKTYFTDHEWSLVPFNRIVDSDTIEATDGRHYRWYLDPKHNGTLKMYAPFMNKRVRYKVNLSDKDWSTGLLMDGNLKHKKFIILDADKEQQVTSASYIASYV